MLGFGCPVIFGSAVGNTETTRGSSVNVQRASEDQDRGSRNLDYQWDYFCKIVQV